MWPKLIDGPPFPDILVSRVLDASSVALPESDLSKFLDRTLRKDAISDTYDEISYDASIKAAFLRFDRLTAQEKKISPLIDPHVDSGKEFLATKFNRYCKTAEGGKVNCSILDRERGYINKPGDLLDELSYPMLCIYTFYDIPSIDNPPLPTGEESCIICYEEYTNSEIAILNQIVNKKFGHTLPTTARTVKNYRDKSVNMPGFVPYCHKTFEGTPIGRLLEAHPKPGRAALHSLFSYFMVFYFEGDKYCIWPREPTRANIVRSFKFIAPARIGFADRDLAEKRFDLLVEYGIIKGWKGYTNKKHLLYYATQKSGPHEIPTRPRTNTREYYISNNK